MFVYVVTIEPKGIEPFASYVNVVTLGTVNTAKIPSALSFNNPNTDTAEPIFKPCEPEVTTVIVENVEPPELDTVVAPKSVPGNSYAEGTPNCRPTDCHFVF